MNDRIEKLLKLVVSALQGIPFEMEISDDTTFFQLARENGFSGMVYPALSEAKTHPEALKRFHADYYQYQAKDIRQAAAITELTDLFRVSDIKHVFLKGVILKPIYPESFMRSMGDIDVLVARESMPLIHSLLPANGYLNTDNGPSHDRFKKAGGIVIEVHPDIDAHFDPLHREALKNAFTNASTLQGGTYRFSKEEELLYLVIHLAKHFHSSGVGARQVLDIGMYARHYENELDILRFWSLLKLAKLERFFMTLLQLNELWFGPEYTGKFAVKQPLDEATIDALTTYVFSAGVHGKSETFNSMLPRITEEAMGKQGTSGSKLRFLWHTMFLPYEDMATTRPYLQKHQWLLPYAWVARWCTLLFKKTKSTLVKLSRMRVDSSEVKKNAELYKKIGL